MNATNKSEDAKVGLVSPTKPTWVRFSYQWDEIAPNIDYFWVDARCTKLIKQLAKWDKYFPEDHGWNTDKQKIDGWTEEEILKLTTLKTPHRHFVIKDDQLPKWDPDEEDSGDLIDALMDLAKKPPSIVTETDGKK